MKIRNISKEEFLQRCNASSKGTMMESLEIEYIDAGEDFVVAQMPVTEKVMQPHQQLHGGATVALAESVGSVAASALCAEKGEIINGIEISANHIKSVRGGMVFAKAKCLHSGRTIQLWEIKVTNEKEELISVCKLTTIRLKINS